MEWQRTAKRWPRTVGNLLSARSLRGFPFRVTSRVRAVVAATSLAVVLLLVPFPAAARDAVARGPAPDCAGSPPITQATAADVPPDASVYVAATAYDVWAPNAVNLVYALRARDGALRWSFTSPVRGGFDGSPVLAEGLVYAVAGTGAFDGPDPYRLPSQPHQLYALRASDGTLAWRFSFDAGSSLPLTVANGVVNLSAATLGTSPGDVYALRARDGQLLWHAQLDGGGRLIAACGALFILGSSPRPGRPNLPNGFLAALNPSDGALIWQRQFPNAFIGDITISDGFLYLSAGGMVAELSPATGRTVWQRQFEPWPGQPPVVADGSVVVGSSLIATSVSSLSAGDGSTRWQLPLPDLRIARPIGSIGDVVYVQALLPGSNPGPAPGARPQPPDTSVTYALDAQNGAVLWRYHGPDDLRGAHVVGDVIYASGEDWTTGEGILLALRARDGSLLWRDPQGYSTSGYLFAPPVGGIIYLPTIYATNPPQPQTTYITAVRASDGTVLWRAAVPRHNVTVSPPAVG